jgi:rhamnosyltransferase subunit B
MANILFTSVGTAGDVLPLLRVGGRLKARGHHVSLLTHVSYARLAAEAGLDFAALDDAEEYARSIEDGPLVNTPRGIPEFLRRHYFTRVPLEYQRIRERVRESDTILVARDLFDVGARIAAEKFGIPLVWIFVSPGQLLTPRLRHELFATVLADDVNRLRRGFDLAPVADWRSWLGYPGRSVGIWPRWFAPPEPSWTADVLPVGFVLDNEGESGDVPEEIRSALEAGERPTLITGGTGTFTGSGFYRACVEACRRTGRRAILVTPHDGMVPTDLPDTIRRYSHLPLGKLMPFMEAVIHHGGRGTMSCALASGTPQVMLAWGADRPDNAARAERLGVARYLPRPSWDADTIGRALETLAGSSAVRVRCRELAERIAGTDSLTAACEVIENPGAHPAVAETDPRPVAADRLSPERLELLEILSKKREEPAG